MNEGNMGMRETGILKSVLLSVCGFEDGVYTTTSEEFCGALR